MRLRPARATASQAAGLRRGARTRATLAPKLVPPSGSESATCSREPRGRGTTTDAQGHCRTKLLARAHCRPPRQRSTAFGVPQIQSRPDGGVQARTALALAAGPLHLPHELQEVPPSWPIQTAVDRMAVGEVPAQGNLPGA